jgi:3-methylcrotonyl-CoA carboxylase alpha subunit
MTSYLLKDTQEHRHQTRRHADQVQVDGIALRVRKLDKHSFTTDIGGRAVRLQAVTHGDHIHVQLNGRACLIERVDPTRSKRNAHDGGGRGAVAPMPGVVVSWLVQPGVAVTRGAALVVIESMKLQMTIEAPEDGVLEDLPFREGQTFPRGAVLALIRADRLEGEPA